MHFSVAFVLTALAFSAAATPINSGRSLKIPLTKRSGLTNADGTVNANFLSVQLASTIAKIQRGFANYEANTGSAHPLAFNSSMKRAAALEALADDAGYGLWQGSITVGTPAITYAVDFDTGSTDLFLPGPNCNTNCAGHTIYNPGASSTAAYIGSSFTLTYGDGSSVVGTTYTDTVAVAGIAATQQTLGVASQYSTGFNIQYFPPDGLLGLAWTQLSVYGAPGYFQTLVAEGKVNSPVFGFKLSTSGSELSIGEVNTALYTGAFTYVPVTQQAYWQVTLGAVNVGSRATVANVPAIVDTGTSLLMGPSSQVAAFYAAVPGSALAPQYGSGIYTVPCNGVPTPSLTFAGRTFPISAATFNYAQVSSTTCIGGVAAISGVNFWIVGDVFLQNVYTEFDVGGSRVGFATVV